MADRYNLIGRRFGRLVVIGLSDKRMGGNRCWVCKCDCGNTVIYPTRYMRNAGVVSCGCYRLEQSKVNLSGDIATKLGRADGTSLSRIKSVKTQRNNSSGVTGVYYNKQTNRWIAYIYFKGKRYHLGSFTEKDEAIKARQIAKDDMHNKFLEQNKKSPEAN